MRSQANALAQTARQALEGAYSTARVGNAAKVEETQNRVVQAYHGAC